MKLAVVGSGIAGLAAAHRAVELARERDLALDLMVFEAGDRIGGTIQTERHEGFLVEGGPDSFLSEKPWALDLCRRLGIEDRLIRTDDRFRRTYVVFGGMLHPLPEGFQLLAPTRLGPFVRSRLFSWPGKIRMAMDLVLPRGADPDESLGGFVARRLGRQALERVAQPLVAGIYTADPDVLSLAATMPRFLEVERKERSLILGLWRAGRRGGQQAAQQGGREAGGRASDDAKSTSGARWSLFVTFADGMEEFIRALASRLPAGAIRLGHRVASVTHEGPGWRVGMADGSAAQADAVIIASESHQAARMVRYTDPGLSHLLEGIPYASSATVTLAWRRADIPHPLDGFGFVVPQLERRPIIACTFASVKYAGRAPEGFALLRVFVGGALNEAVLEGDDDTLTRVARAELGELLGIQAPPLFSRVSRYPKAMPQYHVGHLARVDAIEGCLRAHRGLALVGGAYRGVGIADCVRSAEDAAVKLLSLAPARTDGPR